MTVNSFAYAHVNYVISEQWQINYDIISMLRGGERKSRPGFLIGFNRFDSVEAEN